MPEFGGRTYPTRGILDMLESGVVKSDDEFDSEWKAKLAAMSPTTSTSYDVIGGSGPEVNPLRTEANNSLASSWLGDSTGVEREARQAVWDMASKAGLGVMRNNDGGAFSNGALTGFNPYTDTGRSAMQDAGMDMPSQTYSVTEANPAYAAAQSAWQTERNKRLENNTRQQQAYDTGINGNNAWGGMLPENYTDPNYGMVTGQTAEQSAKSAGMATPEGGLGGLGGFTEDAPGNTGLYKQAAGVFNPLAKTTSGYGETWGSGSKGWGVR